MCRTPIGAVFFLFSAQIHLYPPHQRPDLERLIAPVPRLYLYEAWSIIRPISVGLTRQVFGRRHCFSESGCSISMLPNQ